MGKTQSSSSTGFFKKAVSPLQAFIKMEASGGIVLILATLVALFFANSQFSNWYFNFIHTPVSIGVGTATLNKSFLLLVNDGLMAIFFFLVGLEIKREIMVGELSTPQKASFSIFAAIGGMAIPALFYILLNTNGANLSGWGVPMATDIAFALGVLTLLGNRVPVALKILLLALAIVDDLGAVAIIALFYTKEIFANYLGLATAALIFLFLINKAGLRSIAWGLILGVFTWFCFLKSGVHATIAGVILAFLTPAKRIEKGSEKNDSLILDHYIHALHPWVAFAIMPIFAFFNAGVSFAGVELSKVIGHPVFLGIALGLFLGKPLGVLLFTKAAVLLKFAKKPEDISWTNLIGIGFLAGIGFTMSLFIGGLAFDSEDVQIYSKMGILFGSLLSMIAGFLTLRLSLKEKEKVSA